MTEAMENPLDHTVPRWGQLSYASFDPGNGIGGWQVRESAGNLSDPERDLLLRRVVTGFDPHSALPEFPTPADLEAAPRRLSYLLAGQHGAAYWYAAQAGNDSTGRPGNVYSVALLDRAPRTVDALRPVTLWRSPDFAAPFGAANILTASLGAAGQPTPGGLTDRAAVIDWATQFAGSCWRPGVLVVLLDAIAAALAGGPRVVLAVNSPDEAASWLAAVSFLTSAGVARSLSWSVYERASALPALWAAGVHIAAVPMEDLSLVEPGAGLVLIRGDEQPRAGDATAPHITEAGSKVQVTLWSQMLLAFVYAPDTLAALLERLDPIAQAVGDTALHPAWPLAMAVLEIGEPGLDAREEAAQIVFEASPESLRRAPALFELAAQATLSGLTGNTRSAWLELQRRAAQPTSVMLELLACTYVRLAVNDDEWLVAEQGVPVPVPRAELVQNDAGLLAQAFGTAIASSLDHAGVALADATRWIKLLDLLEGCRLGPDHLRGLDEAYEALLARALEPLDWKPESAIDLVARVGPISFRLRGRIIAQLNSSSGAFAGLRPGAALPGVVFDWLIPDAAMPDLASAETAVGSEVSWFERDGAIHLRATHGVAGLHAMIVRGLLQFPGAPAQLDQFAWQFEELYVGAEWTAAEALQIETAYPGQLPEAVLVRVLACAPSSSQLADLVREVLVDVTGSRSPGGIGVSAGDVAQLRGWSAPPASVHPGTGPAAGAEIGLPVWEGSTDGWFSDPVGLQPRSAAALASPSVLETLEKLEAEFGAALALEAFLPPAVDEIFAYYAGKSAQAPGQVAPRLVAEVLNRSDPQLLAESWRRHIALATRDEVGSLLHVIAGTHPDFPTARRLNPVEKQLGELLAPETGGRLLDESVPELVSRSGRAPESVSENLLRHLQDQFEPESWRDIDKFMKVWWRRVLPSERSGSFASRLPGLRSRDRSQGLPTDGKDR